MDRLIASPVLDFPPSIPVELTVRRIFASTVLCVAGSLVVSSQAEAAPGADDSQAFRAASAEFCEDRLRPIRMEETQWNGWGRDLDNTRYQPDPGIAAADVPRLRVKWTFALDGTIPSQPAVVGDRVFVSSIPGQLYSLDANTGCIFWSYLTAAGEQTWGAGARSSVTVGALEGSHGRLAAFIGDDRSFVHALDAVSGERLWRTRVETHPGSRITGSPVLHKGRLFVPVSSLEEASGSAPDYECCTFRGSIVALDAISGEVLWKSYAIPEEPQPFRRTRLGVQMWGPSGAAIWASPTLDVRRGLVYAATGNSYTDVAETGSASVLAFDQASGNLTWGHQVLADDNFIGGCGGLNPAPNCPGMLGPDYDFGSSVIVRTLSDGRQILLAGNKGGLVYAMDPERQGRILWSQRVGHGGSLGGIQWGMAADEEFVYAASSDSYVSADVARPGLTALRIDTGEIVWQTPAPPAFCSWTGDVDCSRALSGALTLMPGVVFSGSLDGHIRGYSSTDGSIVWSFDTARIYDGVNGKVVRGGSIDGAGPVIAGGTLFVTSGYERFRFRKPGNALIAFTVDGR